MKVLISNERPALSSLLILFGLVIIGLVVGSLFQLLVMYSVAGGKNMLDIISKPETIPHAWWALILMQAATSLIMFIGAGLLYWLVIEQKKWKDFNFKALPPVYIFVLAVVIQFCSMPFNSWLETINSQMKLPAALSGLEEFMKNSEDQMGELTKMLTTFTSFFKLIMAILVIGVIAGIGEELIFRGLVQRKIWLGTGNIHVAIWLSAAIFSAIHFQFYGFLPRLFLGALFGYLYYWSGNLWVPIFAHIFNNSFAVIVMSLINIKKIDADLEKMDNIPLPAVAASFILTLSLLFYYKKLNTSQIINN
jgi:uncharacterized protein